MSDTKRVFTTAEAAKYLGISHPAMTKRIAEGGDAAPRREPLGSRYVFLRDDLDAFVAEHGRGEALDRRRYVPRSSLGQPVPEPPQPTVGTPEARPLSVERYLRERGLPAGVVTALSAKFDQAAHKDYRLEYGRSPSTRPVISHDGVRETSAWTEADRPLLDRVWATSFAVRNVLAHRGLDPAQFPAPTH